jgi:hypothetical protein
MIAPIQKYWAIQKLVVGKALGEISALEPLHAKS